MRSGSQLARVIMNSMSTGMQPGQQRTATVRALLPTDAVALTAFFRGLSTETKSRYGPHPFDQATAKKLCASIDLTVTVRFVALQADGAIVAYMILTKDIGRADRKRYGPCLDGKPSASLAPVVADALQNQGLGTRMAQHVISVARDWGLAQIILMGGVQATNLRARHFYENLGFCRVGEFWTGQGDGRILNYDMLLDLNS